MLDQFCDYLIMYFQQLYAHFYFHQLQQTQKTVELRFLAQNFILSNQFFLTNLVQVILCCRISLDFCGIFATLMQANLSYATSTKEPASGEMKTLSLTEIIICALFLVASITQDQHNQHLNLYHQNHAQSGFIQQTLTQNLQKIGPITAKF